MRRLHQAIYAPPADLPELIPIGDQAVRERSGVETGRCTGVESRDHNNKFGGLAVSNVIAMPKLIAWHPPISDGLPEGWRDTAIALGAILCPPDVLLTPDDQLYYLADRIQRMINLCEDPDEAAETLRQDLFEAGLYLDECRVPTGEAGNRLIWSNDLGVGYRLRQWGLMAKDAGKTQEMPAAREQISSDHYCPEDGLRSWAGWLGQLP